ncbi:efflux RND transporter permease subunit [Photobacterium sagamiensis]|uniref:efflux RND transporter permease subunit n=1 Tax=Photobacterium sagamiensis TaxID=2910241 RepID=UPI003D11453B
MLRLFADHPTAANLLMFLFIVIGLWHTPMLKRETFPEIQRYEVQVSVAYPGAGPRDVEEGICRALDEATDSISFVDEKRCESRSNLGTMTIKMREEGDFNEFIDDVRSAVDGIDNFPNNSETPVVTELGRTSPVVTVALSADIPVAELKDLAEHVKAKMIQDPNIPLVALEGFSQRQLRVELKPTMLRRYNLSIQQLAGILQNQNLDLPLGNLESRTREYSLRFNDERVTAAELGDIVVLSGDNGAEVRLKDIAFITDTFEDPEDYVTFDGRRAALLKISKNSTDDSLTVLSAVEDFINDISKTLPHGVNFNLTQDNTSIIKDRLSMLGENAWQGLLLVFFTLVLFFGFKYSFWVVMGLPVSFLASMFVMVQLGITINMMSMVALLLALGILMDDAIVIAESIASQRQSGKSVLDAVVDGTARVARGVISSFLTTVFVFGALVGLKGDLGQVLRVVPIVLLTVITVSLVEAFLILPNHLHHAIKDQNESTSRLQTVINNWFERQKERLGSLLETAIRFRYAVIGVTIAIFFVCISTLTSGFLKFNALPKIDGNVLEARLIMPSGTPLTETEATVASIVDALQQTNASLSEQEEQPLVQHTSVNYGKNIDSFEQGPHLATISVDLLTAESRNTNLDTFISQWQKRLPELPGVVSLTLTEPALGPSGRAIDIRLSGLDLNTLSSASYQLQQWLTGYPGVYNVFDDLRPGKPEVYIRFKPSAYSLNIDAESIATQLRSAYSGMTISEFYRGNDNLEIAVQLKQDEQTLNELKRFPITHPVTGTTIPLASLVTFETERDVSRIQRINNIRTVSIYGSVNTQEANTQEVIKDTLSQFAPKLKEEYPGLIIGIEGEVKNAETTGQSLGKGLILGMIGVFVLLSFQFRCYSEPVLVMLSIPLALIGVILGHLIMGHDLSMPSMVGFVSLAGIVVNNAILLVEFVKQHVSEGKDLHSAARQASQDRLRAIVLTTSTTVAGMLPLLFETSLQAQVLIPLVISIAFGLLVSTVLVLVILPCLYTILEDWRGRKQVSLEHSSPQGSTS